MKILIGLLMLGVIGTAQAQYQLTDEDIARNQEVMQRMFDEDAPTDNQLGPLQYGSVRTYHHEEYRQQQPQTIIQHLRAPAR